MRQAPRKALYVMDEQVDSQVMVNCCVLWITARRGKSGSEHFKVFLGQFLPPWSLDEMLNPSAMALHGISKEIVEERFERFGGSARLVLAGSEKHRKLFDRELEAALSARMRCGAFKFRQI